MIYFDNAATTKPLDEVLEYVLDICKNYYANSSAMHKFGFYVEQLIKNAKKDIANIIKANEDEIYFTSGATEANNMAIIGACEAYKKRGNKIITTKIEHPSVLVPFKELEKRGFEVFYLNVDEKGYINIQELIDLIDDNTIFVSIMYVNNEFGTIQNIKEIATKIKQKNKNTIFHTDAVQAFCKIDIDIKNIDLLTASGHKIHALKGAGFLFIKRGIKLNKIIFGAMQQEGIRAGTLNTEGILSLAFAAKIAFQNLNKNYENVKNIKNEIIKLTHLLEGVLINGDEAGTTYILNISIKDIKAEVLVHALEEEDIYIAPGAACNSKKEKNYQKVEFLQKENIRLSFSHLNILEEARIFNNAILKIVPKLRLYKK